MYDVRLEQLVISKVVHMNPQGFTPTFNTSTSTKTKLVSQNENGSIEVDVIAPC